MTQTHIFSWLRWIIGTAFFLGVFYTTYPHLAVPLPDKNPMDFNTYWLAGYTWLQGENAYDHSASMALLADDPALAYLAQPDGNFFVSFAYPPFTLPLFAGLSKLPLDDALRVYTALALMGLLSSCVAWLLVLGRTVEVEDVVLLLCIFGLGLGHAVIQDIGVGNVTWWEVTFCWLAIASWVLRSNVVCFAVCIAIASAFKGFLALLLLFPLCGRFDRQTFQALLPGVLIIIGPHMAAAVFDASSYGDFAAIARALMSDEYNFTPRGILEAYALDGWPLAISYLFVTCAILGCTLWNVRRRWRLDGDTAQLRLWTMVSGCLTLGLTVPRMKDYSLLLMLLPILTVIQSRIHPLIAAALAFAVWTVSVETIVAPVAVIAAAWLLAMVQLFKGEYDTPARNPWPGLSPVAKKQSKHL